MLDQQVSKEMQEMDATESTEDVAINMAQQAEQVNKNMKELFDLKVSVSPQTATDAVKLKTKPAPCSARKSTLGPNNSEPLTKFGHKVYMTESYPVFTICKLCNAKGHYAPCTF